MAVIDVKADPGRTDLVVFSLLWLVFMPLMGWLLPRMGGGLLWMAGVAGACLVLSLAFNRDYPPRKQVAGAALPIVLLAVWGIGRGAGGGGAGGDGVRWVVFGLGAAVGLLGAAATLLSARLGKRLYRGWMFTVLPIGWTLSSLLLGIVFFLVITPIGLLMRLAGRDPMQRGFDAGAATYWEPHQPVRDARRYFRQF